MESRQMDGHRYTAGFEAPGGKPILHAYPDPITRGSPWTIGLGHTGHDVYQGETWTEERCWNAFYSDYASAQANAAHVVGNVCWESLSEPRRAVLTDMAFNIGFSRLMGFRQMLAAVKSGEWQKAHDEMLDSEYAKQVKTRADKNAQVILTGDWPHELV